MWLSLRVGVMYSVFSMCLIGLMGCTPHVVKPNTREQTALLNVELGLGYLEQGQRARAKTKLTHAVTLAPNLAETQGAMAYFREMVGDTIEADRLHRQAIRMASHKGAVYNNYGAYLCRQARYLEADDAFQRALKDKNYARTAEVYENAGLCVLKSSAELDAFVIAKAMHYFTQALRHDPNREQARSALERLEQQQHQRREQVL